MRESLREICGVEMEEGIYCLLPPHAGDVHEYDIPLPPAVNRLVAAKIDELEQTRKNLLKYERQARWGWRTAVAAAGLNLGVVFYNVGHYYWGIW